MNVANTAQATGPMTLEQGFQTLKAKMAEANVSTDDLVKTKLDEDGIETEGGLLTDEVPPEPALEDNAEAVSADESAEPEGKILSGNDKITLHDGSEITAEEARKGYLRQAEFTRKTQDHAREREAFATEKQVAMNHLGTLYQQLASLQETEPNWLQLSQQLEPAEYQRQEALWKYKKNVMGQTQQTLRQQQARAENAAKVNARTVLSSGEYEKAWTDPKVLDAALDKVTAYLTEAYPLSHDAVAEINDPHAIIIADKARRFDELQKAKPKAALAVQGKPKPFTPGAKSTASPQSETIRLAQEAFRKNPTPDNAFRYEKAKQGSRR